MANRGNKALDWEVVSKAKIIEVSKALDAPANIADIPANAARGIVTPEEGKKYRMILPNNAPVAPPMVNKGANVPPDVPLPKAIAHEVNFNRHNERINCIGMLPDRISVIFSYPTPSVRGEM